MKQTWPKKHRALLFVTVGFAFAAAGFYLYVLRPRSQEVRRLEDNVLSETQHLRDRGWPVDYERLTVIQAAKERELTMLKTRVETILDLATSTFSEPIHDRFENRANFIKHVSRLDFQEYYVQIERDLAAKGVVVAEQMLNIGENSVSPEIYQLVLQLWTLERVASMALEHGLTPMRVPIKVEVQDPMAPDGAAGPGAEIQYVTRYVSKIQLAAVRAYVLNPEDEEPYVLEFPIKLSLRCTSDDLGRFLAALHADNTFIPLNHIEIRKVPPFERQVTPDLLTVDLECSVFFKLSDTISTTMPKSVKALPRGA